MKIIAEVLITTLGHLNTNMSTLEETNWTWSDYGYIHGVTGKSFINAGYVYAPYVPLVISHIGKTP